MTTWTVFAVVAPAEAADPLPAAEHAPAAEHETGEIPGLPPGPVPPAQEIAPRAHRLAKHLRCPVCQGMSVADSTSEAAVQFQRRIRELVSLGYDDAQITDYFIDRYGEWILLAPPARGLNWMIWLGPGLAGGAGLAWALATAVQWRKEPDEVPLPSDAGHQPKDPYEARLLKELDE
ncbi:MAG: cytochrome c-type biogenesis protein CcmH [Deltaproteobacteria bacterium]|nr:cytochrome c-type biogenesis protein CcmH [Deltaproteobacteria bacterium]